MHLFCAKQDGSLGRPAQPSLPGKAADRWIAIALELPDDAGVEKSVTQVIYLNDGSEAVTAEPSEILRAIMTTLVYLQYGVSLRR